MVKGKRGNAGLGLGSGLPVELIWVKFRVTKPGTRVR